MDDHIEHHGILGMRWGIRRFQNKDGSLTAAGRKRYGSGESTTKSTAVKAKKSSSKEPKTSQAKSVIENQKAIKNREIAKAKRRIMSDSELKKTIQRLKDEKELKELIDNDISPGKTRIMKILGNVGDKTATTMLSGLTLYASKAILTGEWDAKDLAGYVAPKPKSK